MIRGLFRTVGVAVASLVLAFAGFAQTPQSSVRFDVTGYAVEGSPLLNSADFSRIVSPLIGRQKTAADVQKARQTLQQAYFDLGHCSVQVTLPRPEPDAGVVTFRLVQTPVPRSKDCLPMLVLDEKRATPPVPVAPGEVAVRPFTDITGGTSETAPRVEPETEIARATVKPLQDRPVTPAPKIAASPALREDPAVTVTVKPLAEVPAPQPGLVASSDLPAGNPVAKPVAPDPSVPPTQLSAKPDSPLPNPGVVVPPVAFAPKVGIPPVIEPPKVAVVEQKPVTAPVEPGVTVKPFSDASATVPDPITQPDSKPEIVRAPVRPLQDRAQPPVPPPAKPEIAAATVPEKQPGAAARPESIPPTVAAPVEKKPVPKPAPVVVRAPPEAAEVTASVESTAAATTLKFDIERYLVQGNTLLKPEAIGRVLRSYTGRKKDFADVQRALEALQTAYQETGYSAVQVTLPEQELERGEVQFEVIETRLGKIDVEGNQFHNEQNIRNSLPNFRAGTTPNSLAIASSLRVANENPSKQTQVALRTGTQEGEVDATIKVIDDNPVKYSYSMDNTGSYATGKYRVGFGYQHANMFNRDHVFTLQYITSPEHPSNVTVLGLGYRIPLYKYGDSIDLIGGYSDVQSGTVQQLFNVAGAGTIFGARYNLNLERAENYEHKIVFGLDYRAFKNNVTFVNSATPLIPDITVHPASVTYSGLWRGTASQLDFYASYSHNIFPGGNDGAPSDFKGPTPGFPFGARAGAKAGYNVIRAGATYTRQIWGEWQARAVLAAQQTDAALIAGEQFGIGGADSVRGFDERAYANDRGYRGTFELYTPDMADNFGWEGGRIRFLAFYDTANVTRNFAQPGEAPGLAIDSYGLGLRLQTKNFFSLRLDYAQVAHDGGVTAGIPDGRRNSNTAHATAVWVF